MRIAFIIGLLFSGLMSVQAQIPFTTKPEKTETRKGNGQFKKENYTDAEASYKKALDKKNNMPEAVFNLGDAVYEQKRYEEAAKQFQLSAQTHAEPLVKAKAYHNLGNSFLEQKKWPEAIKAYKSALKINPKDADTKYNLAYANAMMQQQQGSGGQNDQKEDQKDKKDEKQDQQNQDNKEQKQDQQQAKQDEQKQQQGKEQQGKLSKEEAEKLLQALMNEEQKTNQKMQQKQMKATNIKIQKDW